MRRPISSVAGGNLCYSVEANVHVSRLQAGAAA